jgi:polar amino acid transport system substrate-binding protein
MFFLIGKVEARDLKAALPRIPMLSETKDKGLIVDLVKAMDEIYDEGKISIEVFPPARGMDNVINKSYDFYVPLLKSKSIKEKDLDYAFSDAIAFSTIFVLYTNKNNNKINARNAGNYIIETDDPLMYFFGFKAQVSIDMETSLRKVDSGRIDGYIYSMNETDGLLKQLGLKNIKKIYYGTFDASFAVKKGPEGKEVGKILEKLLKQLKKNGTYEKIMAPMLNQKFVK